MSISATLYERTPYVLAYQLAADGAGATPDTCIITNRDTDGSGATPARGDLRFDADVFHGSPIDNLVNTDGITNSAAAKRLLTGAGLDSVSELATKRAHINIYSNAGVDCSANFWSALPAAGADVDSPGSDGYACIQVWGPNVAGAKAVLTIQFQHSYAK